MQLETRLEKEKKFCQNYGCSSNYACRGR